MAKGHGIKGYIIFSIINSPIKLSTDYHLQDVSKFISKLNVCQPKNPFHVIWEVSLLFSSSSFGTNGLRSQIHERNSYVLTIMRESHRCIHLLKWKTHKLIEKVMNYKNDTLTLKLVHGIHRPISLQTIGLWVGSRVVPSPDSHVMGSTAEVSHDGFVTLS